MQPGSSPPFVWPSPVNQSIPTYISYIPLEREGSQLSRGFFIGTSSATIVSLSVSNGSILLPQTFSQVTHAHQSQLHRHRLLGEGGSLGCLAVSKISFPFHVVEALGADLPKQPKYTHLLLSLSPPAPPPPSCLFVQVIFRQKSVVWSCLMVTRVLGRPHGWEEKKVVSKIVSVMLKRYP
ncbi:uncharacterized protein LY79DRAFT_107988 [Colletotrichum navitas]|uniref:Uncharacterized protein n=1 Tax=Colletotrichum navitas TaxID=681940 RepID=A0AAD8Q3H0_9PEZI|nr:uncharacterized protein LY79DRAFT_107988 [Colletotrichum navitas]KAK1595252.1 hypothetical protein LY79DRAFT_107988 [Colletotrichum navitas]